MRRLQKGCCSSLIKSAAGCLLQTSNRRNIVSDSVIQPSIYFHASSPKATRLIDGAYLTGRSKPLLGRGLVRPHADFPCSEFKRCVSRLGACLHCEGLFAENRISFRIELPAHGVVI